MQYLLLIVILYGLSGNNWQVHGFGFGAFVPSPFCPAPAYYVVAPSYSVYPAYPAPSLGFFDTILQTIFAKKGKGYPPAYGYPPPPPLYYPPPPPPVYYPPPPPQPPPAQPPAIQDHIIKVHITKESGGDDEQHHHHHHHDYGQNSDYYNWD